MKCPNCSEEFEGNFCSQCGQKSNIVRLNMKEVFEVVPNALFLLERRYVRTIMDFIRDPLKQVKSYSDGKRKHYAPPVQFFYFFATISLLLSNFLGSDESNDSLVLPQEANSGLHWIADQAYLLDAYSNFVELGLPLMLGVVLFLIYRKKLNVAESLAFAFYSSAIGLEILPMSLVLLPEHIIVDVVGVLMPIVVIMYSFSFLGSRRWLHAFVGLFSGILSFALFVFVALLGLYLCKPLIG